MLPESALALPPSSSRLVPCSCSAPKTVLFEVALTSLDALPASHPAAHPRSCAPSTLHGDGPWRPSTSPRLGGLPASGFGLITHVSANHSLEPNIAKLMACLGGAFEVLAAWYTSFVRPGFRLADSFSLRVSKVGLV